MPTIPPSPYGATIYVGPNGPVVPQAILNDLAAWSNGGVIPIWIRYQYQWSNIETSYNSYVWNNLDTSIANIHTAGLKVLLPVQGAPNWRRTLDQNGNPAGNTQLTAGITHGVMTSSVNVAALPTGCSIPNGSQIVLDDGAAHPETVQVNQSGGYSGGATSLNVVAVGGGSWTPTYDHAAGALLTPQSAVLPSPSDFASFAQRVTARYGDTVDCYQQGNEEWDTFGTGSVRDNAGTLLANVCKAAYPLMRANTTRMIGMCAVRKTSVGAPAHIQNWISNFFSAGGGPYTDFVDCHYYRGTTYIGGVLNQDPTSGDVNTPSVATELAILQAVIAANGFSMPVWCLETGWDTLGTNPPPVTQSQQSQYIQAMYDACRKAVGNQGKCFIFTADGVNTKSVTQGSPPSETYLQAYGDIKNYILTYPAWSPQPVPTTNIVRGRDGHLLVRGRDGLSLGRGRDGALLVHGR